MLSSNGPQIFFLVWSLFEARKNNPQRSKSLLSSFQDLKCAETAQNQISTGPSVGSLIGLLIILLLCCLIIFVKTSALSGGKDDPTTTLHYTSPLFRIFLHLSPFEADSSWAFIRKRWYLSEREKSSRGGVWPGKEDLKEVRFDRERKV